MSQFFSLILAILAYFLTGKAIPQGAVYSSPVGAIDAATLQFIWALVAAVLPVIWGKFPQWQAVLQWLADLLNNAANQKPQPIVDPAKPEPKPVADLDALLNALLEALKRKQQATDGKPV